MSDETKHWVITIIGAALFLLACGLAAACFPSPDDSPFMIGVGVAEFVLYCLAARNLLYLVVSDLFNTPKDY